MPHFAPQDPFDLLRAWFKAFNAGDLETLLALYHDDAAVDLGHGLSESRQAVRHALAALAARSARRTVRMIARVETGAMHAEWRGQEGNPDSGETATCAGYDDFWIEDSLIRRQRSVIHPLSFQAEEETVPVTGERPPRQYPAQPIVGVGAVILQDGPVVDVFDRILLDPERRVRYHYVLIDYLCRPVGGALTHGSDVAAAELVEPGDLARYRLTPKATAVIEKALSVARSEPW
jgi:hypothetical protein